MILNQNAEVLPEALPPRRGFGTFRGVIVGIVLGAVGFASFTVPMPLLTLYPGPTPAVFDLVKVEAPQTPAGGSFHITTVCVGDRISFIEALRGWLAPSVAVISRSAIYPPGRDPEDVNREQIAQMDQSKLAAAAAALRELGYKVEPYVSVESTQEGTPASGAIEAGDVIVEVDGKPITTRQQVGETIRDRRVGQKVNIRVRRGNELKDFTLETVAGSDEEQRPIIGVALAQKYNLPFEVTVDSRNIGGPSAGLMFAVGIVDQLDPADLSHGYAMAGTGTINDEGLVGAVGGVEQKVVAADKIGAKYFFVPEEEQEDARASAPSGMTIIGVGTLHDAVEELRQLSGQDSGGEEARPRPKGIERC